MRALLALRLERAYLRREDQIARPSTSACSNLVLLLSLLLRFQCLAASSCRLSLRLYFCVFIVTAALTEREPPR